MRQIQGQNPGDTADLEGYNIKLGGGGIREPLECRSSAGRDATLGPPIAIGEKTLIFWNLSKLINWVLTVIRKAGPGRGKSSRDHGSRAANQPSTAAGCRDKSAPSA